MYLASNQFIVVYLLPYLQLIRNMVLYFKENCTSFKYQKKQQGAGSNLMLFNFIFVDNDPLGLIDVRYTPF